MPIEEHYDDYVIYKSKAKEPPANRLEERCEAYIEMATRIHDSDDITITDKVDIPGGTQGAWVSAWIWVNDWDGPEIIEHFTSIDEWTEKRLDR